jgi:membrane fusion protein, multidrug efflux system
MNLLRAFALLLPTALLAACGSKQPPADDVRVVRTTTVTADDGSNRSDYSGEVRARHESSVGFRVAGRIAVRLVEVGSRVQRNQPLARLDAVDAELNVGSARAQLASVRSEHAQVELDFQRAQRLFERRFISQAEFDRDRVQMEGARAKLTAAEAEFALASNQHSYTVLLAPQDGIVTELRAEAGEVVQVGQAIATIAADGEREVVVGVPESRLEEIRAARELQVELWARPGKLYAGRVRELAPMTDSATRQYTARIAIVDADPAIELGMTAHVRIAGQRTADAYRLPLTALYQKNGKSFVWIVAPDSSLVQSREVEVADVAQDAVVIASGVEPGDTIVTAGVHLLFEGQHVRRAAMRAAGEV